MSRNTKNKRIGILGGGQLARMMILKAHEMGIPTHVLCPNGDDPAAQVTQNWHRGSQNNLNDLVDFFKSVDIVTFESEFCDVPLIKKANASQKRKVAPSLGALAKIQDRLSQKKSLEQFGLSTSPFVKVDNRQQAEKALENFKGGMVLKRRRFGYDGYGTFVVRSAQDLAELEDKVFQLEGRFIAEAFIPFERELAIVGFRNQKGEFVHFPISETHQEDSRCLWVKGPIKHSKSKKLVADLKRYMDGLNYTGALALELFEVKGKLIVNEVAPRVHNSGHYSLDGLDHDQFSLHIRAILNQELPKPRLIDLGYAMYNLLGHSTADPKWTLNGSPRLHWYGKKDNRPGRKMGHLNVSSHSGDHALKLLKKSVKEFQL